MSVIPVIIRNKKIMRRFKQAGAIGPDKAITAQSVGLRDNFVMGRFVAFGFLARKGDGYYIPVEFTQTRRWRLMFGKKA